MTRVSTSEFDPADPHAGPASAPAVTHRTRHGHYVDLLYPEWDQQPIDMRDIAHHLSLINRFNGATAEPYSVAEHSVTVARMVSREGGSPDEVHAALLHDAPEAYLGDVNGLLKRSRVFDVFRDLEGRWERVILCRWDLGHVDMSRVSRIDKDVFTFECAAIRDAEHRVAPSPEEVRRAFLLMHSRLCYERFGETRHNDYWKLGAESEVEDL